MMKTIAVNREELPSGKTLMKATVLSAAVAGTLLVTTVLPAEYGIDPTGLGAKMGLTALHAAPVQPEQKPAVEPATPAPSTSLLSPADLGQVWKSTRPFRSDALELTLQPGDGAEVKASMVTGERLVFSWEAKGGVVNFDMHGEEPNAGDEFTSYWKGKAQASGHGAFVAPFEGTHGWFWRNRGDTPVTITVSTSGYYNKLYKP